MQSSIFWFDITNVFITEQITFYWFPASAVASAVVHKEIKMLLTNGISIFLASGKLISSNGSKSLPWNSTDQTVLSIYVFWYFFFRRRIIFKRFKCRSLNNNLCEKLVLSSPIIYDENLQVTFFTFLLLTLGLDFDKLTFILLYCVIYGIYCRKLGSILTKYKYGFLWLFIKEIYIRIRIFFNCSSFISFYITFKVDLFDPFSISLKWSVASLSLGITQFSQFF